MKTKDIIIDNEESAIEYLQNVLTKWDAFCIEHPKLAQALAILLQSVSNRKASEVAKEIFEEIDRMIYHLLNDRHYIIGDMCYEVEALKKKYTEGEK